MINEAEPVNKTHKKLRRKLLIPGLVLAVASLSVSADRSIDLSAKVKIASVQEESLQNFFTESLSATNTETQQTSNLIQKLEDVKAEKAAYALKDNRDVSMDCAKIIASPQGYLAVYHTNNNTVFEGRLALSKDLSHWEYITTLDTYASQLTIFSIPNGGYIVGEEKNVFSDGNDNGSELDFKYYKNIDNLFSARADKDLLIPRTQSEWNEGTPNIYSVTFTNPNNPDISQSIIEVGFHYNDLSKEGDREANGVIKNFSSWNSQKDKNINSMFEKMGIKDIGDRDFFSYNGHPYIIYEARKTKNFADWRTYLFDVSNDTLTMLNIQTQGESFAFANPTVSIINGKLIATDFIPKEGSTSGESGEMLYSLPLN